MSTVMLNNRQKYMINELERIIKKASISLELLDKHIPNEHKSMKPPKQRGVRKVFTIAQKIEQMKNTITMIQDVFVELKSLNMNDIEEEGLINTLRSNLKKMTEYYPAQDLLILKEGLQLTSENFIASYGFQNVLSSTETVLQSFQSIAISAARAICYVVDCLFTLVVSIGKAISTGENFKFETYSNVGETPFALATTGHFQFFPNQSKTLHDIVEELGKAHHIFVEEFGSNLGPYRREDTILRS